MTNIKKTREEIIYELLISLNQGNVGYFWDSNNEAIPRINMAIAQYDALVERGVITEE